MSNNSKNHHFVPRSILKNFSIEGKRKQVYVYDKKLNKSFPTGFDGAGSENYFNTIKSSEGNFNFESLFDEYDNISARITLKITKDRSFSYFTEDDFFYLLIAIATQHCRVKMRRTSHQLFLTEIEEFGKRLYGKDIPMRNPPPGNEEVKAISYKHLLNLESVVEMLYNKDMHLIETRNMPLWISDNPIVMHNALPYGRLGFEQRGIEIYYPISDSLAVVLVCSSFRNMLKPKYKNLDFEGKKMYEVLTSKGKIEINDRQVNSLNRLQIVNSSRFLYGPKDEFSQAIEFLNKNPKYKEIKSDFRLTNEAQVFHRLPEGEIIVAYGKKTQCMIRVYDFSDLVFKFKTPDIDQFLKTTENGTNIEKIEYYKDKRVSLIKRVLKVKDINWINNEITLMYNWLP